MPNIASCRAHAPDFCSWPLYGVWWEGRSVCLGSGVKVSISESAPTCFPSAQAQARNPRACPKLPHYSNWTEDPKHALLGNKCFSQDVVFGGVVIQLKQHGSGTMVQRCELCRLRPNVISYGAALSACARVAKWQHAIALLQQAFLAKAPNQTGETGKSQRKVCGMIFASTCTGR